MIINIFDKSLKKAIFGTARLNMRLPNPNVMFRVEFEGRLSMIELESVLTHTSKKHLLLNSRITIDKDNQAFYEINDEIKSDIRKIESNVGIEEVILQALREEFDLVKGPLIRFYLKEDDSFSTLIICCHHVICDGLSFIYLINDIIMNFEARDYQEINYRKNELKTLDKTKIPDKLKDSFIIKAIVKSINTKYQNRTVDFSKKLSKQIHSEFWSKHHNGISFFELSEDETIKVIKSAKMNDVSVNTVLVTLFQKAQHDVLNNFKYSNFPTISVNIRQKINDSPKNTMGFFASAIRPKLKYNNNISFWENATNFQLKIKKLMTEKNLFESQIIGLFDPKFIDELALAKHGKSNDSKAIRMVKKKKMNQVTTGSTFANLGKVEFSKQTNNLTVKAAYGPIVYGDTMEKYIGIVTLNGKMYITISYNHDLLSEGDIEKIKKNIIIDVKSVL